MISNLFRSHLFYRLWAFALIAFGALLISLVAYAAPAASSSSDGHYYYVEQGDTLSGIARHYGVSVKDIVYFNSLSNANILHIGQPLYIPSSSDPGDQECYAHHTVARGQTLSWIAKYYGVDIYELARINNIENIDYIRIGVNLCLPQIIESRRWELINIRNEESRGGFGYATQEESHSGFFSFTEYSHLFLDKTIQLVVTNSERNDILNYYTLFMNNPNMMSTDIECTETNLIWEEVLYSELAMTPVEGISGSTFLKGEKSISRLCLFNSNTNWSMLETLIGNQLPTDYTITFIMTEETDGISHLHTFIYGGVGGGGSGVASRCEAWSCYPSNNSCPWYCPLINCAVC